MPKPTVQTDTIPPKTTLPPFDIEARLGTLPKAPGVYIMKDRQGAIVYVGKSINLRTRVRSYFRGGDDRPFVKRLPGLLGDIETLVTETEFEALRLEASLIRKHRPRFNIALMDDSLWLRIGVEDVWPTVEIVREVNKDGARYFGEYPSARAASKARDLLTRFFMLRTCSDEEMARRDRPCLQYQIKRCLAPCVLDVRKDAYREHVDEAILFLDGRYPELRHHLETRMYEASDRLAFEVAARYRDQIRAIRAALERYKVVSTEKANLDAFGLYREGERVTIQVLAVRGGRIVHTGSWPLKDQASIDEEVLSSFLNLYYDKNRTIPEEILLPCWLPDQGPLEALLAERRDGPLSLLTPTKEGERRRLVAMARRNALHTFRQQHNETEQRQELMVKLQQRLRLGRLPKRIECFDISNLQGQAVVGAMAVFQNTVVAKKEQRHFKIKTVDGQDDFASMREIIERRFQRFLKGQWPRPDLVIIDGGKGQLGVAHQVMVDLGIEGVDLISLAKSRTVRGMRSDNVHHSLERVFVPGRKNPIILKQNSAELFLLQRVRDEAHDLAVSYHRKLRRKASLQGTLEKIPGVGPGRHKALLTHFGSIKAIKKASVEELGEVQSISGKLARTIWSALHPTAEKRVM